jgi:flagellar hook-associated protein 1 FlgK
MYVSTFSPLQTALSGVEAAQAELDTTGENITNENTAGYVTQTVNLTEAAPLGFADGSAPGASVQLGTGVDIQSVTNNANQYLDATVRTQTSASNAANTEQSYLSLLQSSLNEPSSSGISSLMSGFWSAWNSLAATPTSSAAKQVVYDDGEQLAQALNALSQRMSTISGQATTQFNSLTGTNGEVDVDAQQIAQLNSAIRSATSAGQNANVLIDQRNKAISDLSTLATVSLTNNADGTVTVGFGDAASPLVSGTTVNWPQTITSAAGGTLGAILNLTQAGGEIAQYSASLDGAAAALVSEVNSVAGLTTPFFSGTTAGTIAVAVTPAQVSATSNPATSPGGNDVAVAEAALSGGTADQTYQSFVSSVGSGVQSAQNNQATQSALLTAAQQQQQSFEGVDLSQESTNMVMEQRAYQASAQVMNAFSTMMDSLMTAIGA